MGMREEKAGVIPREECCSGYERRKAGVIPRAGRCSGYERVKRKSDTQSRPL